MDKKLKPLTTMQYTFCTEYVKNGGNAYQAALTAGYGEHYALTQTKKIIQHPSVNERIQKAFAKVEDKLGVSFEWRVGKLKRIVDSVLGEDEVKLNHAKVAISAIAEINKMYGDYAPEKRMNMTVNATLDKLQEARKAYDEY